MGIKRFFVLVPPRQKRIRYIRIRFGVIVALFILLVGGITGFFIPFNAFTPDVVELNQKNYLTDQNRTLLSKIRTMREVFFDLQNKVDTLERMKERLVTVIEADIPKDSTMSTSVDNLEEANLDNVLSYLNSVESFYNSFEVKVDKFRTYFDRIPVIKPIFKEFVISAPFGKMRDPFTGDMKMHKGIDFSAKRGTPVVATASGVVDLLENHSYWGKRIRIRHSYGFSTVYAHLGSVKVRKSKRVNKGDIIGTVGITGLTTGPHLHYEIHRHGVSIDPQNYFFNDNITLASSAAQ